MVGRFIARNICFIIICEIRWVNSSIYIFFKAFWHGIMVLIKNLLFKQRLFSHDRHLCYWCAGSRKCVGCSDVCTCDWCRKMFQELNSWSWCPCDRGEYKWKIYIRMSFRRSKNVIIIIYIFLSPGHKGWTEIKKYGKICIRNDVVKVYFRTTSSDKSVGCADLCTAIWCKLITSELDKRDKGEEICGCRIFLFKDF